MSERRAVQAQDSTCQQYSGSMSHPDLKFDIDSNGHLVRQLTVDSAIQTVVSKRIRALLRILPTSQLRRDVPDYAK